MGQSQTQETTTMTTYATQIMNAAIENSAARSKEVGALAQGSAESVLGTVWATPTASRNGNSFKGHTQMRWQLGRKVISAANLEKALNEAAQ